MEQETMLTTFDNPFDPFEDFTSWFLFDVEQGYYTCAMLARIANVREDYSEKENDEEIDKAMDSIIENDFLNIYKKVTRKTVSA